MRTFSSRASFILLLATLVFNGCQSSSSRSPGPFTFRVMTFNIHHGEGADGRVDLVRIAQVINEERADLVSLQEVDRGTRRTSRLDMPAELASLTGLSCVFSNNFSVQGGEYGNAILSRFPVLKVNHHLLPHVAASEQRGLLETTIQLPTTTLTFFATHLDHQHEPDRLAGARVILDRVLALGAGPVIVAGDFNTSAGSETYRQLDHALDDAWLSAGIGPGFTIPIENPSRRIDFIWYRAGDTLTPKSAQVKSTSASDHLPVVVEFEISGRSTKTDRGR